MDFSIIFEVLAALWLSVKKIIVIIAIMAKAAISSETPLI